MDFKVTALNRVKECLSNMRHFVLQGGAGSGKTETLKELLAFVAENHPDRTLVCITHTNKAADEILTRIDGAFPVSTIHSFLHSLISGFKLDIHRVIFEIFKIESFVAGNVSNHADEKDFLKSEFEKFKKTHEKYSKRQYDFDKTKVPKHPRKPDYDKNREFFNNELNEKIHNLNNLVREKISQVDPYSIKYNQRKYDSFRTFAYGHDSLITIAALLLRDSVTLRKILADRFNHIFIDEFQDTSPEIIDVLLTAFPAGKNVVIGLFGDSMQGIYDDGIGDVDRYITGGNLVKIQKEDNFRCSEQVIGFLNPIRLDAMKQEVAFKKKSDGIIESLSDRQGNVCGYYAIYENKPNAFSDRGEKDRYIAALQKLIEKAGGITGQKMLVLTNKAIAADAGFKTLFDVFSDRYGMDLSEQIEKTLSILQFDELVELCTLFQEKRYNDVISKLRKNGFALSNSEAKLNLFNRLTELSTSHLPALKVLNSAIDDGLLVRSDAYDDYMQYANRFLASLEIDSEYLAFEKKFLNGNNTQKRMTDAGHVIDEYLFDELRKKKEKREFFTKLFGDGIPFVNVINYFDYLGENKNYITMHKTKGTGIRNVLVVLEDFFWNKYNFEHVFASSAFEEAPHLISRKLIYVACSRAIENLKCVRLIGAGEEEYWKAAFPQLVKVSIDELH
jgi:DNA helicase-2/ATP-dependent DNA helicase PcrA